jgi:hypothetical protein
MPTQTIGNIKVVVNNQDTGSLSVRQSNQFDSKVRSISYGQAFELKKALDLSIVTPQDGEAITYDATTGNFAVTPVLANNAIYANTANTVLLVAGGTF